MLLRKIIHVIGLTLLATILCSTLAQAKVYLDIASPDFRKVPFAVPYFSNKTSPDRINKVDREMAELLADALEFHGFIKVVPPEKYDGSINTDWLNLGVDFTIISEYVTTEEGVTFEFRLVD